VAGLAVTGGLYALHARLLEPYLHAHGTEAKLLGTGSILTVFHMAGFQLPAGRAIGPVIWALAIVNVVRTGRFPNLAFFVTLPILGLIADRPYWGAIVVPFLILWAGEELSDRIQRTTRRRTTARET